jgi:hypothetical protein
MKYIFFLSSILISFISFAQESKITTIEQRGNYLKSIEFVVKKNTFYTNIDPNFTATSLTFETTADHDIEKSYVLLGGQEKFELKKDEHTSGEDNTAERENINSSELFISSKPFTFFSFYSGDMEGKIKVNLIYAKPVKQKASSSKKKRVTDWSTRPETVDQRVWRDGLPDPKPNPDSTIVKHVILHHAAGSNTDTAYMDVVRNYYILHTQVNGWDDIGYNFLVAQDGTIFDGRDGQNVCQDDNVLGAHMCARNTTTMGICLLGNYHNNPVFPTDTSLESIKKLVVWKLYKEHLSALDSSVHPQAGMLGNIAGHRDGCDPGYTECPGDNYYQVIYSSLKQQIDSILKTLPPLGFNQHKNELVFTVYPNPASDKLQISIDQNLNTFYKIISADGRIMMKLEIRDQKSEIDISELKNGIYFIQIVDQSKVGVNKFIISR